MKRLILLVLGFLCWQGSLLAKNYFYVTALEDSVDISWQNCDIQISYDGVNWIENTDSSGSVVIEQTGDTLFFKGNNPKGFPLEVRSFTDWSTGDWDDSDRFVFFSKQKHFSVGGNLLSMITPDWNDSTITPDRGFTYFFSLSSVVDASDLQMSENLSGGDYQYMFTACKELIFAPKLPAMNLKMYCYMYMFSYCTSLEKAPDLPAKELVPGCYSYIFLNCSKLNYINVSFEKFKKFSDWGEGFFYSEEEEWNYPTGGWISGISSNGVFVAENMDCRFYLRDVGGWLENSFTPLESDNSDIVDGWTFMCSGYEPEEEETILNCDCDTTVNGIYYKLDRELKTAEVTCREDSSSPRYSGVLEIPETIVVDDTTYTVTSISKYAFYVDPESGEDSLIIDEIRLPKTILDIHTPFCCLPLPLTLTTQQPDENDGVQGRIVSNTDVKKIVISNRESLKFLYRDIGASIYERLFLKDIKVDAKMVLEEMTGGTSLTTVKISADSLWWVKDAMHWILGYEWWNEVESLIITNAEKLSSVQSLEYLFEYGCALENVYLPCDYGCRSNLFRWVEYKCNAMRYDYKNGVFLMFGCDTENAIIPPLTEDPLSKLNVRQSEDTLIYLGSMKEWCSDPIYFLPYSVLIIDGKEIKGDLVIPEGVDSIAENAFSKCTSLTNVTLPQTLVYIGENAFANCTKIRSVTCYSPYPPEAFANTFANYNGYLYMPCDYFDEYDMHVSWGSFKHVECSSAEETEVDGLQINPDYNHAEFAWPVTQEAEVYSLQITRNEELVCTLNFNEDGQLTNIDFGAASSSRSFSMLSSLKSSSLRSSSLRSTSTGYKFTVTGLQEDTNYNFALDAKDNSETLLKHYSGDFKTKGGSETGDVTIADEVAREKFFTVEEDVLQFNSNVKTAVYDMLGRCLYSCEGVGSFQVPARGVYLIKTGFECFKIVID